jgi:uracil-DNA glycosylase family 4
MEFLLLFSHVSQVFKIKMKKPAQNTNLRQIHEKVIACRRCPRLVRYLSEIKERNPDYWCKPVPGFGDPDARILLLGLAPGRSGSNRTGRMFTGDASGKFLFQALYDLGLANQEKATHIGDRLRLKDIYITAIARCAPPKNKPSLDEIRRCSPFVMEEIQAIRNIDAIVALGRIAHDGYLRLIGERLVRFPFQHGAVHRPDDNITLVDTYHPSRQNTNTGRLTMPMFLEVFEKVLRMV